MKGHIDWKRKTWFWASPWLLIAAALWVGAPTSISESPEDMKSAYANIIVEFAAPLVSLEGDETAPAEGPAEIAARILSHLEPEARESARVFEHLPYIALVADAETMLRLIAMPEVLAILPDREFDLLPAPSATDTSDSPVDTALPDDSGAISIPEMPGEVEANDRDLEPLDLDVETDPSVADE